MYLLERTFSAPVESLDPKNGIYQLVEDARMEALARVGVEAAPVDIPNYVKLTNDMVARKDIVFRSTHEFEKNGIHTFRHVVLYESREVYLTHVRDTLGIPEDINESDLDMNLNGLTAQVMTEEIKRT